jgi:hypothetical protein
MAGRTLAVSSPLRSSSAAVNPTPPGTEAERSEALGAAGAAGPLLRDTPQRRIAREAQRANEVKERVRMLMSKGHECTEIADDKQSFTWCHQVGGCDAVDD